MAATDGLSLDRIVLLLLVEGDVEQRLFVVLVVTVGGGAPALYGQGSATMKSAGAGFCKMRLGPKVAGSAWFSYMLE